MVFVVTPPDIKREYEAIKSGAGIRLLDDRLIIRVSGDDRVSFMHGMCTADVKSLLPGTVLPALFLTEHAHVIADCLLYALEEPSLWVEVERRRWAIIREHLERFLVADDVELDELDSMGVLDIEGPESVEALVAVFGAGLRELGPWQHLEHDGFRIANLPRYGGPAFTIIANSVTLGALRERMKNYYPEVRELNSRGLEIQRIENGLALIGTDTDERTLALEARLEPAIAFNKGCYVGQETIERATARGALKRRLFGLRIAGSEMPSPGAVIQLDGRAVGHLTSIVQSPAAGIIGLAILHHSAWTIGTHVSIATDKNTVTAMVCDLPFGQADSKVANEP
jgi:folate-binding protein YgfZ